MIHETVTVDKSLKNLYRIFKKFIYQEISLKMEFTLESRKLGYFSANDQTRLKFKRPSLTHDKHPVGKGKVCGNQFLVEVEVPR